MLKLTSYPVVMLIALLFLGKTKFLDNNASNAHINYSVNALDAPAPKAGDCSFFAKEAYYYKAWDLASAGLSEDAFTYALKGFDYLNENNKIFKKNILTIVDFSKSSTERRLYVLDLQNGEVLFNTLVAHGQNSGGEYANEFSNRTDSHQSSLGFYVTMGTYRGRNGYSLKLNGCEKDINDKALARAIVIHGANYVSNSFIHSRGFLGRSYGCPSLPPELSKEIIDTLKNGSCIFLYHPTKKYTDNSKIINS